MLSKSEFRPLVATEIELEAELLSPSHKSFRSSTMATQMVVTPSRRDSFQQLHTRSNSTPIVPVSGPLQIEKPSHRSSDDLPLCSAILCPETDNLCAGFASQPSLDSEDSKEEESPYQKRGRFLVWPADASFTDLFFKPPSQ